MDYKSVLEEQIRELQKLQDNNVKAGESRLANETAMTIINLVAQASQV